eukprot:TRINITY_DN76396_c0_g1_i1.p1 TRINITY_DN76396_c0_g1~~TRINITY_DN76396_c0_g1_i1.p1  ORF type:complete len:330 (-),score=74.83 TRINITY_DN76396_c0_g1_i1:45-1034(-)
MMAGSLGATATSQPTTLGESAEEPPPAREARVSMSKRLNAVQQNVMDNLETMRYIRSTTWDFQQPQQPEQSAEEAKRLVQSCLGARGIWPSPEAVAAAESAAQLAKGGAAAPSCCRGPDAAPRVQTRPTSAYDAACRRRAAGAPAARLNVERFVEENARWMGPAYMAASAARARQLRPQSAPTGRTGVGAPAQTQLRQQRSQHHATAQDQATRRRSSLQFVKMPAATPLAREAQALKEAAAAARQAPVETASPQGFLLRSGEVSRPASAGSMRVRCKVVEENARKNAKALEDNRRYLAKVKRQKEEEARRRLEDFIQSLRAGTVDSART